MTLKKFLTSNKQVTLTPLLVFGLLLILFTPQVSFAGDGEQAILKIIWGFVNMVFGNMVWLAGSLLDYTISDLVVGFGFYYTKYGIGSAVDLLWTSVRDIFNLTFIFGLVYIGFKTILDSSDSSAKKTLATLIMAALLVNFSLFITKTVIDFSNIAAKQFVQTYEHPKGSNQYYISDKLMGYLGVETVFNTGKEGSTQKLSWSYVFGAMYLYLVAAFVFLAGAILLLIRFIVLNVYMLLSPVMFIGWVFPGFNGVTKKYWEGFLGQAFFAPAYFLMIYFSMKIIESLKDGLNVVASQNLADSISGVGDYNSALNSVGGILMFFLLACGFMIASLIVAKKIGASGAITAVSLGQKAAGKVGNYTKRTVTKPARVVGKWGSNQAGNLTSRGLRNLQTYNGPGGGAVRWAARTNVAQDTIGAAAKKMQNAKFGSSRTTEEDRRMRNQTDQKAQQRWALENNNVPPITPAASAAEITERQNARQVQQATVRRMGNDEILEMARADKATLLNAEFASLLSDAQVTALENSGILTEAENEKLNAERDAGTFADIDETLLSANASYDNLTTTMENLNRTVSTMSNDRLQGMKLTQLTNPNIAAQLSSAQITTLQQSGNFTPAEIQTIKTARNTALTDTVHNGSLADTTSLTPAERDKFTDQQRRRLFRNAEDAGRLPAAALADPAAQAYLTPQIITAFLNSNPSTTDIISVRDNVHSYISAGGTPSAAKASWNKYKTTVAGMRFGL